MLITDIGNLSCFRKYMLLVFFFASICVPNVMNFVVTFENFTSCLAHAFLTKALLFVTKASYTEIFMDYIVVLVVVASTASTATFLQKKVFILKNVLVFVLLYGSYTVKYHKDRKIFLSEIRKVIFFL